MKEILIINGAMKLSGGALNKALCELMQEELKKLGKNVKLSHLEEGYEINAEVAKWKEADVIIWQFPGYWMGEPWIVKKYLDEFSLQAKGILYASDGRSLSDESKRYGSGGLCQGKAVMLSTTWNAPLYAFNEIGEFFDGRGFDELFTHFYKIHQFMGFTRFLPSFMVNDVYKNPNFTLWQEELKSHIKRCFT